MEQPISKYCEGEKCRCGAPAAHKIEETIFDDDPRTYVHPLTQYVCEEHFNKILRPYRYHGITGTDVAALLSGIHKHHPETDKIYYLEEDLLPVLEALGLPAPDWGESWSLEEWQNRTENKKPLV